MNRSEKLILVRDGPVAVVSALDSILLDQGYERAATRTITEDFTPMLNEVGGPVAFVLSPPYGDWIACFSSLALAPEWDLAEALAATLEQPVIYVLCDADHDAYLYRFFENGVLREESLPDAPAEQRLDQTRLLRVLARHGVEEALIDDRVVGFAREHLVVGYTPRNEHNQENSHA